MADATAIWRATIAALAPAVLLAALVAHPFIETLPDAAAVGAAVAADTTHWAVVHLMTGVGSGLVALAFLAVRGYLREAGEERWSAPALPFVVMGSTLYAILPGMEFAPLAAAEAGADIAAAHAALDPWFLPTLVTAAVTFALGAVGFAIGIARSGVLSPSLTWLVAGALIVLAAARFVPLGLVQFYVAGLVGIVALWPLAYVMWRRPAARATVQPRSASAA